MQGPSLEHFNQIDGRRGLSLHQHLEADSFGNFSSRLKRKAMEQKQLKFITDDLYYQ